MSLSVDDLTPEVQRKLGIKKRATTFTKESVRSYALKVLEDVSDLTQDQRKRVLEHALKVNRT